MNACREFIMTCAEVTATTPGSYIPVKKTLPVLYKRIGEEQVNLMLASFVIANYHGRMQNSVHQWAIRTVTDANVPRLVYWPEMNPNLLYDFAKEVIKRRKREGGDSPLNARELSGMGETMYEKE